MKKQPANSPDTNILDFGFFHVLQSLQFKQPPAQNIDKLIANVNAAWEQYDPVSLNKIWLSHQAATKCILEARESNDFPLPHIQKGKLENEGKLPTSLELCKGVLSEFRTL